MSRSVSPLRVLAASVVVAAVLTAPAAPATPSSTADADDVGTSESTAAGSCWEIKQLRPDASSGDYWLLTPTMPAPQRFYCDMTTDGGGWVLVAKGRSAWTTEYDGKGAAKNLRSPETTPMSARTVQYPATTVDGLLGGGRVDELTDGVRLRRATNAGGTSWQESRLHYANRDRWAWSFGAGHPLRAYGFDGSNRAGGQSDTFGDDNAYRRVDTRTAAAQGYRWGFAYGSSVRGSNAADSYLWSQDDRAGGALPYTQMYLRPRVTSDDPAFPDIPDNGTQPRTVPAVARSKALDSPWGVSGTAGSTSAEGNVEVQAFAEGDGVMYVGGNFRYVQRDEGSTGSDRVEQSYLAAFDVDTGDLVRSFTPELDEQVRSLAVLPNGTVVAAGDFSRANGRQATAVVALDPDSGETVPGWDLHVENRLSAGVLRIRTLSVQGDWLYLGGAFTHLTGAAAPHSTVYARSAGRVAVDDARPDRDWNPEFNGTVVSGDASADGDRYYAAGYFGGSRGVPADRAAAVRAVAGAPLASPSWSPAWSTPKDAYQQAIGEVGDRVWVGGSEHSLFSFATSDFARLSGNITIRGGDFQAMAEDGDVVYAGCHCNNWNYSGAYTWPSLGSDWSQGDAIGWVGAWDTTTGQLIPAFVPSMRTRLGSGVWALAVDSAGRLWAGGDIRSATTQSASGAWAGGFARFARTDAIAPTTPSAVEVVGETATTLTLRWEASTDADGPVSYQVLRDDRTVATTAQRTLKVPKGGRNRFFVRAVDGAGNISASSPAV